MQSANQVEAAGIHPAKKGNKPGQSKGHFALSGSLDMSISIAVKVYVSLSKNQSTTAVYGMHHDFRRGAVEDDAEACNHTGMQVYFAPEAAHAGAAE
ncbi:MAG: hypothetical protein MnENMB40S_01190 [Rhizobiaceae bacterium MnEN-MB40S]|nr:MAG: hypothetical protein MnENMB40S_01190 [Rhizobiaceae bacterium MnEN-MB40S]